MLRLYSYWRSSSAYRVRIALNLKGLEYDIVPVNLAAGEQNAAPYASRNPERLVPALEHDGHLITQSLSICDYLDEIAPEPLLMPRAGAQRRSILSFVSSISCDIQPLNNLRILNYLSDTLKVESEEKMAWYRHWVGRGFDALEAQAGDDSLCVFGDQPTLADCFLMPQLYNAHRFDCPMQAYPRLTRIEASLSTHPAFVSAHPDNQPDRT